MASILFWSFVKFSASLTFIPSLIMFCFMLPSRQYTLYDRNDGSHTSTTAFTRWQSSKHRSDKHQQSINHNRCIVLASSYHHYYNCPSKKTTMNPNYLSFFGYAAVQCQRQLSKAVEKPSDTQPLPLRSCSRSI